MRCEVSCWKPQGAADSRSLLNRSEDCIIAPEQPADHGQITCFDGRTNQRAADPCSIHLHRRNLYGLKTIFGSKAPEQIAVAPAAPSEEPTFPDAYMRERV